MTTPAIAYQIYLTSNFPREMNKTLKSIHMNGITACDAPYGGAHRLMISGMAFKDTFNNKFRQIFDQEK